MNKSLAGALIVAAALMVMGCEKTSEKGGATGNDTFRLVAPGTADVNQGEVATVRLVLERGAAFKQSVKLEVKAAEGIQVEPSNATVQPGDKGDVQLKITVAKDVALGEHKIGVKGTPDNGEPTQTEFRINVRAK